MFELCYLHNYEFLLNSATIDNFITSHHFSSSFKHMKMLHIISQMSNANICHGYSFSLHFIHTKLDFEILELNIL